MKKIIEMIKTVLTLLAPQLAKEDSKVGIQETKEALVGLNMVSLLLLQKFKDGVQVTDFTEMFTEISTDKEFKEAVEKAYENYKLIPEEVKDIDGAEGAELVVAQLDFIEGFQEAIAKKEEDEEKAS